MISVAIPFVPYDSVHSPNVRLETSAGLTAYYDCILVAFASLRRCNPELPLVFVSSALAPSAYRQAFESLGVSTELVDFKHEPPPGYYGRFAASLYLLDALGLDFSGSRLFLDPDVVCVGSLTVPSTGAVGGLTMNTPIEMKVNGVAVLDAGQFAVNSGLLDASRKLVHYGGEALVVPSAVRGQLYTACHEIWTAALREYQANDRAVLTTEEHVLSVALAGFDTFSLDTLVDRVWTTGRFRHIRPDIMSVPLWHLPAEKDRGFRDLAVACEDRGSWFWQSTEERFRRRVGHVCGVKRRSPRRYGRDVLGSAYGLLRPTGFVSTAVRPKTAD